MSGPGPHEAQWTPDRYRRYLGLPKPPARPLHGRSRHHHGKGQQPLARNPRTSSSAKPHHGDKISGFHDPYTHGMHGRGR